MRWLPTLLVLVCACSTFDDLEREHPFPDCPAECGVSEDGVCVCDVPEDCPTDYVANEIGECIPVAQNNNDPPLNLVPNNTTPNNLSMCQDEAGVCCDDGDPTCCVDTNGMDCQNPPTNNQGEIPLGDLAIGIVDVTDCTNGNGDGADIFAVSLTSNGSPLPLQLIWFEPGPGADQQGIDFAQAVIEASDPAQAGDECPTGEVISLGCGGGIAVGIEANGLAVGLDDFIELHVGESGPQCDGATDQYNVVVCPLSALQSGDQAGCITLGQGVSGAFDIAGQPADFLP